jgi:hypothetical protein
MRERRTTRTTTTATTMRGKSRGVVAAGGEEWKASGGCERESEGE